MDSGSQFNDDPNPTEAELAAKEKADAAAEAAAAERLFNEQAEREKAYSQQENQHRGGQHESADQKKAADAARQKLIVELIGSKVVNAASFKGKPIPPRRWLIDDMIPQHKLTMLNGDGGVGKSLLALQLAASVASGGFWLGQQVKIDGEAKGGNVLFLTAEDDLDEVHRRLADIVAASGIDYDDLSGLEIRSMVGEDAILALPGEFQKNRMYKTVVLESLEYWLSLKPYALVVLDTLANLNGGNESDRLQVMQFATMITDVCFKLGLTVVLLAHPSQAGKASGDGFSGSTAWNGSVRARLYLTNDTEKDGNAVVDHTVRYLTAKKSNYSAGATRMKLRWVDGAFQWDDKDAGTPLDKASITAKAERVFLELLRRLNEQGIEVSPTLSSAYAPAIFAKRDDAQGITKDMFRTAMEKLLDRKAIVAITTGPPSKQRTRLKLADQSTDLSNE